MIIKHGESERLVSGGQRPTAAPFAIVNPLIPKETGDLGQSALVG